MIFEAPSRLTKLIYLVSTKRGLFYSFIRKCLFLLLHTEISRDLFKHNLQLIHPFGIIIHPHAKIGVNVTIFNNVTIGSVDKGGKVNTPTIGDDVIIYPYSIIIGKINIGKNSIIKPGSVIDHDIPEFSIVGGNPASVLKIITIDEYNKITAKEIQ